MKRVIGIVTASLLASTMALSPALAQGNSGKSMQNPNSASEFAPGQQKRLEGDATDYAPGQMKQEGESAREFAPGQMKDAAESELDDELEIDTGTTASTGQPNFGSLISTLRSGDMDLSTIEPDADVSVVEVDDLIEGNNRSALDNALSDLDEGQLEDLRAELDRLDLDPDQVDRAIAADVDDNGDVTVFLD